MKQFATNRSSETICNDVDGCRSMICLSTETEGSIGSKGRVAQNNGKTGKLTVRSLLRSHLDLFSLLRLSCPHWLFTLYVSCFRGTLLTMPGAVSQGLWCGCVSNGYFRMYDRLGIGRICNSFHAHVHVGGSSSKSH